jgi:integrase
MKLTKRIVDAARPKGDRFIVWDEEIKGFGLLVLPTGVKSYVFNYRTAEGTNRRITIGQHGTWTPTQAREKAEDYRDIVRRGQDPLATKRALKELPTVGELLDAYLLSQAFAEKAPSTRAIDVGRINRHLRPLLGKRHAHLLTTEDIKRALVAIRDGKTAVNEKMHKHARAVVTGGAGTAREAIILLRAIFTWGMAQGFVNSNPCIGVKTGTSGTRETILESRDDYARLHAALERMEREGRLRSAAADAIRFIAVTGCRRGEAIGLRWAHVDLKQGRVVLPPSAHKTGRKTGKPREITLAAVAQAIIARQPAGDSDAPVFTPSRGAGRINLTKAWVKVRAEAQLPAGIGLHGLRHSLASHLAMGGAEAAEIMAAMGHKHLAAAQRYVHFADEAKHRLAERAASVAVAGMGEVLRLRPKHTVR